jgi:nicotinate-nucleotide adenylyltransferase
MWIVTKQNPLKNKPYFDVKDRIKLSKKITSNQKKISVKYLDDRIKSKNTYDLLNYLNSKNKKINFFLLIGADNLIKFHKWKNWKKIPKLAKIVVFARGDLSKKIHNCIASKNLSKKDWTYVNSKKINISSSLIRKI